MAWNQPDEQKPRAPQRAPQQSPGPLARWRRLLRTPPRWPSARTGALMGAVLLLAWIGTGLHQIETVERAQVLRLGREVALLGPGGAIRLPWPIETLRRVDVETVRTTEVESRMRSAGGELLDLALVIRWRVNDARTWLSGAADPEATLKSVGEAALRPVVATLAVEDLLGSTLRDQIAPVRAVAQARLDALGAGISVEDIDIARVEVPNLAGPGARELSEAVARRSGLTEQTRAYETQIMPIAQQRIDQSLVEARAYRGDVIATAESDAARFEALLPAYREAPKLLRQRMYIDAVEDILGRAHKVVVDNGANAGAPIYLPLDRILAGTAPAVPAQAAPSAQAPGQAPGKAPASPVATSSADASATPAATPPPAANPGAVAPAADPIASDPARARERTRSRAPEVR